MSASTWSRQRAGRALDLTTKELALLSFFLRHPGQVLTRKQIYENVWDGDFDTVPTPLRSTSRSFGASSRPWGLGSSTTGAAMGISWATFHPARGS